MTDIHTHILPHMDDGAKTAEMSIAMLKAEAEQQVDTVILTPHFYRRNEKTEDFLSRRRQSYDALRNAISGLPKEERDRLPRLLLGAEVAWLPGLASVEHLQQLCLADTDFMLVELPSLPWDGQMIDRLYDLRNVCGITPIIAHFERYLAFQKKEYVWRILEMDVPVQIGSEPLLHIFGRKEPLRLLREGAAQIVASDCHNLTDRAPNLGRATEILRQKLGRDFAEQIARNPDEILFD